VATTALILVGLALIVLLEATGRRRGRWVVALGAVLLGAYALVLALPVGRTFFALAVPLPQMVAAAVAGSAAALAGLWLVGERFRISRRRLDLHSHRRDRGP
jgi:hypothetical protein